MDPKRPGLVVEGPGEALGTPFLLNAARHRLRDRLGDETII